MILLDTHYWYWWVGESPRLTAADRDFIEAHVTSGLAVSMISCWEIAKKAQLGKLELDRPADAWLRAAVGYPGVSLIPLDLEIISESTRLPDRFRSDPADELIVATSRVRQIPLMTADSNFRAYSHVRLANGTPADPEAAG